MHSHHHQQQQQQLVALGLLASWPVPASSPSKSDLSFRLFSRRPGTLLPGGQWSSSYSRAAGNVLDILYVL